MLVLSMASARASYAFPEANFGVLPATNGMNVSIQISTDLVNWLPVCTNTVLKGSAQFVDPDSGGRPKLFHRIVPVATPPGTGG